jgi:hypothetical protein
VDYLGQRVVGPRDRGPAENLSGPRSRPTPVPNRLSYPPTWCTQVDPVCNPPPRTRLESLLITCHELLVRAQIYALARWEHLFGLT